MIQIFLNGYQAVPKSGTSIKLTSENPFFTKSASYTYEVELPLDIPRNRALFGDVDRLDTDKPGLRFSCRLVVDNAVLLTGTAHVTAVTERSVKVQLLGADAAYNLNNKLDDLYVDDLDLGNWYLRTWPDCSYFDRKLNAWQFHHLSFLEGRATTETMKCRTQDEYANGWWDAAAAKRQEQNMTSGAYPWTACPAVNTTTSEMCNRMMLVQDGEGSTDFHSQNSIWRRAVRNPPADLEPTQRFCPQPFVWALAEYVAEATGLTLARQDNALFTDPFLKRIFVLNSSTSLQCRRCMPHWSVNEWWTQIEQTFGVVASVDYESKSMTLKKRASHYTTESDRCFLDEVVDEFTVEVDDDTQADVSVCSVGFSQFDADPYDLIPDSVREKAPVERFADSEALRQWGVQTGASELASKHKNTLFECGDGRRFIYVSGHPGLDSGFVEVDKFRPRLTSEDSSDVDIELKFVPATVDYGTLYYFTSKYDSYGAGKMGPVKAPVIYWPGRDNSADSADDGSADLDIQAVLDGSDEEPSDTRSDSDLLYMAIAPDGMTVSQQTVSLDDGTGPANFHLYGPFVKEVLYIGVDAPAQAASRSSVTYTPRSLSLVGIAGEENLASNVLSAGAKVNTKMRHCIKFLYRDGMPDPKSLFIIRNRMFVCEKIEADISETGLGKMFTGYFFPVEM